MTQIPREFIDELLARTDIIAIVDARVKLRKSGSNFQGLCPFHNEKTPSFSVNQQKQFFYCFGCGAHGNAIGFLMQFEHLSFVEAVKSLAVHVGMEVPHSAGLYSKENPQKELFKEECYISLAKVKDYFQAELGKSQLAQEYIRSRGLNDKICQRFAIGYAPNYGYLLQDVFPKNGNIDLLLNNGVLVRSDSGRVYEKFHQRLIFPIHDRRGRVIAFGGRTLGSTLPKYLNSPETPLFHKGEQLYGLYQVHEKVKKIDELIVVEGYMDVVSLAQYGIDNAVATMGTAVTVQQVQQMLRETNEIVFCFDGDAAGKHAAWRALEIILPLMREAVQAKFLFLPEKEDPDSYVRKVGKSGFLQSVKEALPLSDYFLRELSHRADTKTLDGRVYVVHKARPFLTKLQNGLFKDLLIEKLADFVGIDKEKLYHSDIGVPARAPALPRSSSAPRRENSKGDGHITKTAITLLLLYPDLIVEIADFDLKAELNLPYVEVLLWLITLLRKQGSLSVGAILAHCENLEHAEFLAKLATEPPLLSVSHLKNELLGIIDRLKTHANESMIEKFLQKSSREGLTFQEKQLLQELIAVNKT